VKRGEVTVRPKSRKTKATRKALVAADKTKEWLPVQALETLSPLAREAYLRLAKLTENAEELHLFSADETETIVRMVMEGGEGNAKLEDGERVMQWAKDTRLSATHARTRPQWRVYIRVEEGATKAEIRVRQVFETKEFVAVVSRTGVPARDKVDNHAVGDESKPSR
jgi:hypothetical protein